MPSYHDAPAVIGESTPVVPPERSALAHPPAHLRLWLVAAGGVGLDLWSKHWAFHTLGQGHEARRVVIPYVLEFQTMFNSGALFGIGPGQTTFFIVASILALGLVLWMFAQNPPRRWLLQIALGAILAGALGNMYDRVTVKLVVRQVRSGSQLVTRYFQIVEDSGSILLAYEYPRRPDSQPHKLRKHDRDSDRPVGYVRDFIKIPTKFPGFELWPWVFNVADMLLVGGVGVLACYLWRDRRHSGRRISPTLPDRDANEEPTAVIP